jgi:hypothetical protein
MTKKELLLNYPHLYHMAEHGSWENIKRYGLRSTTALLDLFEIKGSERTEIESRQRPNSVTINHPVYGSAVIRDQKPLSERALRQCLKGMLPTQWYELLNRKVFFWLSENRLMRLLGARAYREKSHCVLRIPTETLMAEHSDHITLSPINSGSTIFNPQPRGRGTFATLSDYPFVERLRKRRIHDAVVELAVDYAVPNIADMVIKVEHAIGSVVTEVLFERKQR